MCMMYVNDMLRINIYIPEELNKQLAFTAAYTRKAKAEVIRSALDRGLKVIAPKSQTAAALLKFAKKAEQIPTHGKIPKDFVVGQL